MWYAGVVPKSLLKVKVQVQRQPRLHPRFLHSAKSIAACKCIAEKAAWWAAG